MQTQLMIETYSWYEISFFSKKELTVSQVEVLGAQHIPNKEHFFEQYDPSYVLFDKELTLLKFHSKSRAKKAHAMLDKMRVHGELLEASLVYLIFFFPLFCSFQPIRYTQILLQIQIQIIII